MVALAWYTPRVTLAVGVRLGSGSEKGKGLAEGLGFRGRVGVRVGSAGFIVRVRVGAAHGK